LEQLAVLIASWVEQVFNLLCGLQKDE